MMHRVTIQYIGIHNDPRTTLGLGSSMTPDKCGSLESDGSSSGNGCNSGIYSSLLLATIPFLYVIMRRRTK